MKTKRAFSLAEILIAVIFLGIVSALTIPNISKSTDRKRKITAYVSGYQKLEKILYDTDIFKNNHCRIGRREQCAHEVIEAIDTAIHPQYYVCPDESKISYFAYWGTGTNARVKKARNNKKIAEEYNKMVSRGASIEDCLKKLEEIDLSAYHKEHTILWWDKTKNTDKQIKDEITKKRQIDIENELYIDWQIQAVQSEFGSENVSEDSKCSMGEGMSPWVVTSDNIGYSAESRSGYENAANNDECASTRDINAANDVIAAWKKACGAIYIDYNGPLKGPNIFTSLRKQGLVGQMFNTKNEVVNVDDLNFDDELEKIDRFVIFIGKDGITAGPQKKSLTGIIMSEYGGPAK